MTPAAPIGPPREAASLLLERPTPGWARGVLAALVLASFLVPPLAAMLALALLGRGGGPDWLVGGPFGAWPAVGTAGALLVLGLVVDKLWLAHARRRWGACLLGEEELLFTPCLGGTEERVPLADVTGWEVLPHGLLLQLHARPGWARWTRPLLIPCPGEAELREALARLEAPRAEAPGAASFGAPRPLWYRPLAPLLVLGLLYGTLGLIARRHGIGLAAVCTLPLMGLLLWALVRLEADVVGARWGVLHLGRAALLWGRERIPWGEVERVGWTPRGELALEAGARRVRARVAPRLAEAQALLERRLDEAGSRVAPRGPLPAWAGAAARRRRLGALAALWLGPPLLGAALAACELPIYDDLRLQDDDGTALRLVYRRGDRTPRFCSVLVRAPDDVALGREVAGRVIVPGPFGPRVFGELGGPELDLVRGRARGSDGREHPLDPGLVLHLWDQDGDPAGSRVALPPALTEALLATRAGGLAWVESVPALLDGLSLPADPLLAEWLEGRRGRRTFDVIDARGWRLVWGVDRGQVRFCVVAPAAVELHLELFGCHESLPGGGVPVFVVEETLPLVKVDATGRILGFPGPLPEHAELLRATRAVRAGASLREASPELAALEDAR